MLRHVASQSEGLGKSPLSHGQGGRMRRGPLALGPPGFCSDAEFPRGGGHAEDQAQHRSCHLAGAQCHLLNWTALAPLQLGLQFLLSPGGKRGAGHDELFLLCKNECISSYSKACFFSYVHMHLTIDLPLHLFIKWWHIIAIMSCNQYLVRAKEFFSSLLEVNWY